MCPQYPGGYEARALLASLGAVARREGRARCSEEDHQGAHPRGACKRTHARAQHARARTRAHVDEPHGDVDVLSQKLARQVKLVESDDDDGDWASRGPPKRAQTRSVAVALCGMRLMARLMAWWGSLLVVTRVPCLPRGPVLARHPRWLLGVTLVVRVMLVAHLARCVAASCCVAPMQDAACSMRGTANNVLRLACCTLHLASCMQRHAWGMPCRGG